MDVREMSVIRIGLTLAEARELKEFIEATGLYPSAVADTLYDKLEEILDGEKAYD